MTDNLSTDAFCESLRELRPANAQMDVRELFFAAGVEAARREHERPVSIPVSPALAAMLACIVLTAPLAYRAGRWQSDRDGMKVANRPTVVSEETGSRTGNAPNEHEALLVTNDSPADETAAQSPGDLASVRNRPTESMFSRWMNWEALVTATQLERVSEPTLSVFHASVIAQNPRMRDLTELPFPLAAQHLQQRAEHMEQTAGQASPSDSDPSARLMTRPLSVRNSQTILSRLEQSR